MIETTTVAPDDVLPPLSMRLNPIWWLQSGGVNSSWTAPLVNNGAPYLPEVKNQLLRNFYWWCRNPCGNFVGFILGFEGRTYTVTGSAPVLAITGRDCTPQQYGFRWALIDGWAPYLSYWGGWFEFYCGWRPAGGGFGTKMVWHAHG